MNSLFIFIFVNNLFLIKYKSQFKFINNQKILNTQFGEHIDFMIFLY